MPAEAVTRWNADTGAHRSAFVPFLVYVIAFHLVWAAIVTHSANDFLSFVVFRL